MHVAAVYGKEYAASCSCALIKCGSCVNGGDNAKAKFILFKDFLSDYEYVQEVFTYSSIVDAALEGRLSMHLNIADLLCTTEARMRVGVACPFPSHSRRRRQVPSGFCAPLRQWYVAEKTNLHNDAEARA